MYRSLESYWKIVYIVGIIEQKLVLFDIKCVEMRLVATFYSVHEMKIKFVLFERTLEMTKELHL